MINGHGDDVYRYNEVKINFSSNVYGHFSHIDLFSYLSSQLYKVSHYPEAAPITVANFKKLVNEGFYNGLTFHRVVKGFMIQGGDPTGNGDGGTGETIKGEFASNGVPNSIKHERGVLSMARWADEPDSASSQFFIVQSDSLFLDGNYAGFGKVTEGMEYVDRICKDTPVVDNNGKVLKENQPIIEKIIMID